MLNVIFKKERRRTLLEVMVKVTALYVVMEFHRYILTFKIIKMYTLNMYSLFCVPIMPQ